MALKNEDSEGIRAELIMEVIGKPPEHLTETLHKIIDAIGKENGVKVIGKKVNEPQPMKDEPQFYTNFASVEVEVEEILHLAVLMFKYMPANIDIISPEHISLTNNGWNEILNELVRRLHGYDEIARVLQVERSILENKLREILEKNPKILESTQKTQEQQAPKQENKAKKNKPSKKSKK